MSSSFHLCACLHYLTLELQEGISYSDHNTVAILCLDLEELFSGTQHLWTVPLAVHKHPPTPHPHERFCFLFFDNSQPNVGGQEVLVKFTFSQRGKQGPREAGTGGHTEEPRSRESQRQGRTGHWAPDPHLFCLLKQSSFLCYVSEGAQPWLQARHRLGFIQFDS